MRLNSDRKAAAVDSPEIRLVQKMQNIPNFEVKKIKKIIDKKKW